MRVKRVCPQQLQDATESDAISEGFCSLAKFKEAIMKMYPSVSPESWLWAIEFERVLKEVSVENKAYFV